jgi:Cu(I)/Ag(I) efflux system membrane fusion protein
MNKKHLLIGAALLIFGILIGVQFNRSPSATTAQTTTQPTAELTTWTCSMHPQIQQPEPGDCPICGMDLIPLSSDDDGDLGPREMSMSESSKALASIQTSLVIQDDPTAEIQLVGKLQRAETNVKSITARYPARIEQLLVDSVGTAVARGEALATVYSPELLSGQRELLSAHERDPNSIYTKAAEEKLLLWNLLPEQIETILESGQASEELELRSPISGIVVEKLVNQGDTLQTGQALYSVVDLSELWLYLNAFESDIALLAVGQTVSFTVQSYPGETFDGTIQFIEPELDSNTRTIPVRVAVPNPVDRLKPGMFARATVQAKLAQTDKVPLLVPTSAVLRTGKRAVVYIEKPDTERPTYEGREIELGAKVGEYFVVNSGLSVNDRVVTNGAFKIDSALQIQAKPSMMNPDTKAVEQATANALAIPIKDATELLNSYFELHAALAGDDLGTSKNALKSMMQLTGHSGDLPDLIHTMLAADSLDGIRKPHFETLSNALIVTVKAHPDAIKQDLFIMNCPMVYGKTGADWLQANDQLLNPYFGAMMLRCGDLKETINQ